MVSAMVPEPQSAGTAIAALARRPAPSPEEIDAFIASHAFPIVEGNEVTFVFRGHADRVLLQHWVYGLPGPLPLDRIEETDLWYRTLELPPASRVEYKLLVVNGGHESLIQDPLNDHLARDPFGANSVCAAAGYVRPDWSMEQPDVPRGEIQELVLRSSALSRNVPIRLYLPSTFRRSRRYPLLVVHDGSDYMHYSDLQAVLDNLIHRREIAPLIVALTDSSARLVEYADHEPHARFLTEEMVPRLETRLPLRAAPAGRCLMGASFGAVAALSTACRYPGFYDRLLLESGSFAFTDIGPNPRGPRFEPVVAFMNRYRRDPVAVADRVFVSCGRHESLIHENRALIPLLQGTGMQVRYAEAPDGHNWENWRDRLRDGLSWLFPGQLWMVYE